MNVKYLEHSGFLVETITAYYLFDYIGGELPDLQSIDKSKQWYVFVSHIHADHFKAEIFNLSQIYNKIKYILSYDVCKKIRHSERLKGKTLGLEVICANANEKINISEGIVVDTLKSTDEGVAFVITEPEGVIYHAGDLNWWHWEEENYSWNRNMEVNFKQEIDRLRNIRIDVAFIPLDPRQGKDYWLGMQYFLEKVYVDKVYPMHYWKQLQIISQYIKEHGGDNQKNKNVTIVNEY